MRPGASNIVETRSMLQAGAIGLGYGVIAYLCLTFTRFGAPVESIWLSNALLVAALISSRPRVWGPLILCAAGAHLAAHLLTGDTLGFSAAFLAGDMTESVLCALLLKARAQTITFLDRLGIFHFLAVCAFSALISATVAWGGARLSGRILEPEDFYVWFGADSLALAIFTPIFTGFGRGRWRKLREKPFRLVAAAASVIALSFVGGFFVHVPTLRLLLLPLLVVIAFDLGVAGVEICLAVLLVTWSLLTIAGFPVVPWVEMDTRSYLIVMQLLTAVITATVLPLAVVLEQRQRLNETLADTLKETREAWGSLLGAEARYRLVVDNVSETVMRVAPDGVILFASPACADLLHVDRLAGRNLFDLLHPDDGAVAREQFDQCVRHGLLNLSNRWSWRMRNQDTWVPTDARATLVAPGGAGHEEFIIVASVADAARAPEAADVGLDVAR